MFFYSKYSNYDFSQLEEIPRYKGAINTLLKQVQNEKVREIAYKILYEGGYDDFSVNSGITNNDNPFAETRRRLNFASLLISDPQTFEKIAKDNIILFHGTNSNALQDILKYGVCSEAEANRKNIQVKTGEYKMQKPRDFISFTDMIDLALDYSTIIPTEEISNGKSFGMMIGISMDDLKEDNNEILTRGVSSDTPEIGIIKSLPIKYIKMIAVPKDKISLVSKMVKESGIEHIQIVPNDGIKEASRMVNAYTDGLKLPENLAINCLEEEENNQKFELNEVKELTESRFITGIKQIWSKLKAYKDKILGVGEKTNEKYK